MNSTLLVSDSQAAFELWRLADVDSRISVLKPAFAAEQGLAPAILDSLAINISNTIGQTLLMPGPTGETNELYTQGRGVVAIGDFSPQSQPVAVLVHLFSALAAGNSAIVATSNAWLKQQLSSLPNGLATGLVSVVDQEHWPQLIMQKIAVATYIGESGAQQTAAKLAEQDGALVPLVEDSGSLDSPVLNDPKLSYRYITERTRTINITAVGGNATLLELGAE